MLLHVAINQRHEATATGMQQLCVVLTSRFKFSASIKGIHTDGHPKSSPPVSQKVRWKGRPRADL